MTLSSHMPGIGNATETITVDCITAVPTSITYSAYFPADVLNDPLLLMNQNGTARFQFTTELGPAKLSAAEDESFTYIMQPVKKII
jgi:DNA polymerase III sliding clamp (beta) subunit (PCNA family)